MARKSSSVISDEELEGRAREPYARSLGADESPLDQRMLDLDEEAESPFLRGQKRVPVRRGALPRNAAGRVRTDPEDRRSRPASSQADLARTGALRHAILALPSRLQRQHHRFRHEQCCALADSGRDGQRYRSQHLLCSPGAAQETTGADSLGAIGRCHAVAAEPPEDRRHRENAGGFRRGQLAHRDDRRQRRDHGIAGEPDRAIRSQ